MTDTGSTPQPHAVDIDLREGVVTATIVGPVIEANRANVMVTEIMKAIEELADEFTSLVLDLGEITYINSSGLGACSKLASDVKAKGAKVVAYCPNEIVLDIFRLVKADQFISFVKTPDGVTQMLRH